MFMVLSKARASIWSLNSGLTKLLYVLRSKNMFNRESGGEFRWYKGKRLLAEVRGGDYAHAGGEEAIAQVFEPFPKDAQRTILDVGCGQGGSANFVQKQGWGQVVGFDIEEDSIKYARNQYPDVTFFVGDAADCSGLQKMLQDKKFDVIYMLHAFCLFADQLSALQAARRFAHDKTTLILFEYDDLTDGDNPLKRTDLPSKYFNAISATSHNGFKKILQESGWQISNIIDITPDFQRWYGDLLAKMEQMKNAIIEHHGAECFATAQKRYGGMLEAINQKKLGGCIIYATAADLI